MRPGGPRPFRPFLAAALLSLGACAREVSPTAPIGPDPVPNLGTQSTALTAGATAAEYLLVLANTSLSGTASATYSMRGVALAPSVGAPPGDDVGATRHRIAAAPVADIALESRLRDLERAELTGRIEGARSWYAQRAAPGAAERSGPLARRGQSIPAGVRVGDIVRINVQAETACSAPVYHGARVAAIGQRALVLEDTLNPKNGFTEADYRRFAARFDTLVYPMDSAAFGEPTDIDGNGHIALVFTRAVNELTPRNQAGSYFAGFAFSRDLFPIAGGPRTVPCPGSNEGEYFYLLAPDPAATINGNQRTTAFVDSITTSVVAHELEHLINIGRRLYVNGAPVFEDKWLDEGLAHIAEELLFYRESGIPPRANIDAAAIRRNTTRLYAYNRDMVGNEGRYRSYLQAPSTTTAFAHNDDLATRGAAWSLVRYLVDRRAPTGEDALYRLANSRAAGVENLVAVFGAGVGSWVRDWNVSHAVDDVVTSPELQQPSWNWHSIYASLGNGSQYPLPIQGMSSGITYSGSVISGGAAYFRITVPANSTATISLAEQGSAASSLSLVTIRTK
jgi:hypothetical protein